MPFARPTAQELRTLAALALPVTLVQLGMMAMGVEDVMIVGRYSADALAGVAIGSLLFFSLSAFGLGVIMGIEPVISQAVGAKEPDTIVRAFQRGLVLVAGMGTLTLLVMWQAEPLMLWMGQPRVIVDIAAPYLRTIAPSIYAYYLFSLARLTLQSHGQMRPIVTTIVVSNAVNIVLGILLVFGGWGVPRLGPIGAGIATLLARWISACALLGAAWSELRSMFTWRRESWAWAPITRLLRLGAPAGATMVLEYGVFAVVGLVMGNLGPIPAAGHQVALNIASLTFMVPLGVGTAGSVMVGRAIGAGRPDTARRTAMAALTCGVGFMVFTSIAFTLLPHLFASAYTSDAAVVALAATLIPIAGVFQVFDGLQVVSIGLLRGSGDTRTPMLVNLIGYWVFGLPLSLWLGRGLGWGPAGLWWGLVAGLAIVGLVLAWRVSVRLGGTLERVRMDAATSAPPVP
jgi:MATE family multidrug resistance protein